MGRTRRGCPHPPGPQSHRLSGPPRASSRPRQTNPNTGTACVPAALFICPHIPSSAYSRCCRGRGPLPAVLEGTVAPCSTASEPRCFGELISSSLLTWVRMASLAWPARPPPTTTARSVFQGLGLQRAPPPPAVGLQDFPSGGYMQSGGTAGL